MDKPFLSQEEVDALLGMNNVSEVDNNDIQTMFLSLEEQDVLSEIGNINAGSASTALSELLSQRVIIDTPNLKFTTPKELQQTFNAPYLLVEVEYTSGIEGNNVFVLKASDAAIIANLMMGGDGNCLTSEMDEITLSAVSEAMNQMIGFSATSMSQMFSRTIEISPPKIKVINFKQDEDQIEWNIFEEENIAVISFELQIGELLKSEIMLIMTIRVAKQQVNYLISGSSNDQSFDTNTEDVYENVNYQIRQENTAHSTNQESNFPVNSNNLNLILDIPLKLTVLLGKTKRNIFDVLKFTQGSIVELERLESEPVDILVNDTLIARGEVVVVKEYFGVRITDIISAENRIKSLVAK